MSGTQQWTKKTRKIWTNLQQTDRKNFVLTQGLQNRTKYVKSKKVGIRSSTYKATRIAQLRIPSALSINFSEEPPPCSDFSETPQLEPKKYGNKHLITNQ